MFNFTAPTVAPTGLSGYNTSSKSLVINWKGVDQNLVAGPIQGYRINCTATYPQDGYFLKNFSIVTTVVETFTLTDLDIYMTYTVTVAAFNAYLGVYSQPYSITTDDEGNHFA